MRRGIIWLCTALLLMALALPASANVAGKYVFPVTKVQLNRTSAAVRAGQKFTLLSKVSPVSRASETVLWSSSDPAVAVVTEGVVTAVAPGSATITAKAEGKSATCAVRVASAEPKAIKLNASIIAIGKGDTYALEAIFTPSYAVADVSWASADKSVATVDPATGVVTGVGLGTTRVRARASNGKAAFCTVEVTDVVRARSVQIHGNVTNLSYNQKLPLSAVVTPANAVAEDRVLTWSSSNPAIAQVDPATGLVIALSKPGKVVITVQTGNGRTASCKMAVKYMSVRSVSLNATSLSLDMGESAKLSASVSPSNATDPSITWSSSDEAVASVSADGVVTAHASGRARITAKANASGASAACSVYVRSVQAAVTITATGDITIGGDPRRKASDPGSLAAYEKLYAKYNGNFLGNLKEYFTGDDITLVNLESCLTDSNQAANKTYTLRARPEYVNILTRAGVEIVGNANNHTMDFGAQGFRDTRSAIKDAGLLYAAGTSTAVTEVKGVKVGVAAFNQTGAGVGTAPLINAVKTLKRSARCDIVVASVHWGVEFAYSASAAQRTLARALVNAGADLVVGHHSHVVSGIETYKGKVICYSLGTLSSCVATPEDMDAFLYQQTFKCDVKSGLVESGSVRLIPVSMSTDDSTPDNVNDAKPHVLAGADRARVLRKIKYYSRAFAATLPESCYE